MSENSIEQPTEDVSKLVEKIKTLEAQAKQYAGIDLKSAKDAIKFRDDHLRKQEEDKGNYDKLLKEQTEKFEAEKSTLLKALSQELIGNQLGTRIAAKGGDPDVLMAYLNQKEFVKIKSDNGGLPNMELWWDGKQLSPDEFVDKLSSSEKFDRYFKASGNSGGGSTSMPDYTNQLNSVYSQLFTTKI